MKPPPAAWLIEDTNSKALGPPTVDKLLKNG
jgi:hypothetical protein